MLSIHSSNLLRDLLIHSPELLTEQIDTQVIFSENCSFTQLSCSLSYLIILRDMPIYLVELLRAPFIDSVELLKELFIHTAELLTGLFIDST